MSSKSWIWILKPNRVVLLSVGRVLGKLCVVLHAKGSMRHYVRPTQHIIRWHEVLVEAMRPWRQSRWQGLGSHGAHDKASCKVSMWLSLLMGPMRTHVQLLPPMPCTISQCLSVNLRHILCLYRYLVKFRLFLN